MSAEMIPDEVFSVVEYVNRQGSRIIAALDNKGAWNVLCLAMEGHIHLFRWTPAELSLDIGDADVQVSSPYRS